MGCERGMAPGSTDTYDEFWRANFGVTLLGAARACDGYHEIWRRRRSDISPVTKGINQGKIRIWIGEISINI